MAENVLARHNGKALLIKENLAAKNVLAFGLLENLENWNDRKQNGTSIEILEIFCGFLSRFSRSCLVIGSSHERAIHWLLKQFSMKLGVAMADKQAPQAKQESVATLIIEPIQGLRSNRHLIKGPQWFGWPVGEYLLYTTPPTQPAVKKCLWMSTHNMDIQNRELFNTTCNTVEAWLDIRAEYCCFCGGKLVEAK